MGLLTPEEFNAASRGIRGAGVSDIVAPGPAVLLRSGYHAHLRRARPPPAMGPPPTLPPGWSTVEHCVVVEVGPSGKATPMAALSWDQVVSRALQQQGLGSTSLSSGF